MTTATIILSIALVGFGLVTTFLIGFAYHLSEQNDGLGEMVQAMARELKELGSPNVHFDA